ncbi:zinc finger protein 417-like [Liolophura sinensis]|uniref:zinc finger protein 417-like n=1 Tax=Liolophura sinensis TaxID=3198878 RepID=UPI0031586A92
MQHAEEGGASLTSPTSAVGGELTCRTCARHSYREDNWLRHERTYDAEEGGARITCLTCARTFPRRSHLVPHQQVHGKKKESYPCGGSNTTFYRLWDWRVHQRAEHGRRQSKTQAQLVEAVVQGRLFGFVECDIHVPDHIKADFAECPPIFKDIDVSREDIDPTTADFARVNDIMPGSRRKLIGSMFGTEILLATPLLQ